MQRKWYCLLSLALVVLVGCDSNSSDNDAPAVLSPELFQVDVDVFSAGTNAKSPEAGPNFTQAALRVWPVSFVMAANMILPSIVTNAALQAEPVFADGSWTWASTATFNSDGVQFTLEATPSGTGHDWSARVSYYDASNDETLDDFELYTARTENNGANGSWQLYYRVDGVSANVLSAQFEEMSDTERTLTFSIPSAAEMHAGDSVTFSEDGDDKTFHWVQLSESIDHMIMWNSTSKIGSITATNYNNGEKACWDANYDDMVCPVTS